MCVCVCVCASLPCLLAHMSSRPFVWFACGRRSAMCAARGARAGGARWWGVAGCGRIGVTSATNTKRSTSHPHMHTPSLLHPFTPSPLYSFTPLLLYSCAPLLLCSFTLSLTHTVRGAGMAAVLLAGPLRRAAAACCRLGWSTPLVRAHAA